jgi:3-dehydroquinate synthase
MQKSKIQMLSGLPMLSELHTKTKSDAVVFYDQKLIQIPVVQKWLNKFPFKIALNAGESLKTLSSFDVTLKKMAKFPIHKTTTFIAVGGGSVGDFVGFLASTYKRGQRLVHIPSTWLAAIDSAHGGKNGLNFLNVKNQIGTFYPADQIILSKKLLFSQPKDRIYDAYGEAFKIGLINQPRILTTAKISADFLWNHLKMMIVGKYKIVEQDPYETLGLRQVLNLGHTMGHIFESVHKISHGQAVLLGLMFSARYSFHLGYLKQNEFIKICQILFMVPLKIKYNRALNISETKLTRLLSQDKKRTTQTEVNFIFMHKIGNVFTEPTKITDILKEVARQKKQL